MSSHFLLRSFRLLLFPFALLYGGAVSIRNFLYDRHWLPSVSFGLPVICVGNLSVGGTGKSPMVEFLIERLQDRYRVATLSRGYKRRTRGYALAGAETTALEIGDEPLQFHRKFPGISVAVGEERMLAIPQLLQDRPDTQVVILDDGFQHRSVRAGLNLLLTDHGNLFTRDFFLPTGDLRDQKKSYRRADIIVVTKCPPELTADASRALISEIRPKEGQQVLFTILEYGRPYHISQRTERTIDEGSEVLLVTGIAHPAPLKKMLEESTSFYKWLSFPDHHIFSPDDWQEIHTAFRALTGSDRFILTTEKDAVRLEKFMRPGEDLPLFVIPVRHRFLFGGDAELERSVLSYIDTFNRPKP